jgi:ABC-type nickel/cobalt efflux system permease component RcnA
VRHAVAVGGSVAVMHTASVLALGLVVLTLTGVFAPERVYPWLGLSSGVIALALGATLLVSRLSRWSRSPDEHDHDDHGHGHGHDHAQAGPLSPRSLTALAVAGGILPSPTALVVLLAAIALGRVTYGLALIAAFSLGLAGALVVVGVVALRAGDALSSRVSGRTARLVPVLSAASIAALGLVLTLRGFAQV